MEVREGGEVDPPVAVIGQDGERRRGGADERRRMGTRMKCGTAGQYESNVMTCGVQKMLTLKGPLIASEKRRTKSQRAQGIVLK